MSKERVGVIFGGRSAEHEVSIITGHQAMEALDAAGFKVLPIYITKDGEWYAGEALRNLGLYSEQSFHASAVRGVSHVSLSPDRSLRSLVSSETGFNPFRKRERIWADVFFPAIHGTFGEDGTLQGLFELADVPYVGSGVTASAIGIDKAIAKEVFRGARIPVLDCVVIDRHHWNHEREVLTEKVELAVPYPMIVKPVCLGSSIGVQRCSNREELGNAIDLAVTLDDRALVERALTEFIEINCSVLGPPERASVCEQPLTAEKVLSFDEKYRKGGKKLGAKQARSQGMASLDRIIPAKISEEMALRVQELAIQAFRAIGGAGVARVDFLLDMNSEELFLNEINTTPGSLAFYLWEATGVLFDELATILVRQALDRHQRRRETTFSFAANLLRR